MTLKTLRDIQDKYKEAAKLYLSNLLKAMNVTEQELREHSDPEFKPLDGSAELVSAKELRQSALEWIKKLENMDSEEFEKSFGEFSIDVDMSTSGMDTFIKHFFGITEDDLNA